MVSNLPDGRRIKAGEQVGSHFLRFHRNSDFTHVH